MMGMSFGRRSDLVSYFTVVSRRGKAKIRRIMKDSRGAITAIAIVSPRIMWLNRARIWMPAQTSTKHGPVASWAAGGEYRHESTAFPRNGPGWYGRRGID